MARFIVDDNCLLFTGPGDPLSKSDKNKNANFSDTYVYTFTMKILFGRAPVVHFCFSVVRHTLVCYAVQNGRAKLAKDSRTAVLNFACARRSPLVFRFLFCKQLPFVLTYFPVYFPRTRILAECVCSFVREIRSLRAHTYGVGRDTFLSCIPADV